MQTTAALASFDSVPGAAVLFGAQRDDTPLSAGDLAAYRGALLRSARALLRDDDEAADVVQETLLAALEAPRRFAGRSTLKTWLHGIMKHKVADVFRRKARLVPIESLGDDGDDALDALFNADGSWREQPIAWGDPLSSLSNKRFEQVLDECLRQLPANAARAFTLREMADLETHEICDVLGITENNCFVLLHRARLKLRSLLQQHWLDETGHSAPAHAAGE